MREGSRGEDEGGEQRWGKFFHLELSIYTLTPTNAAPSKTTVAFVCSCREPNANTTKKKKS